MVLFTIKVHSLVDGDTDVWDFYPAVGSVQTYELDNGDRVMHYVRPPDSVWGVEEEVTLTVGPGPSIFIENMSARSIHVSHGSDFGSTSKK